MLGHCLDQEILMISLSLCTLKGRGVLPYCEKNSSFGTAPVKDAFLMVFQILDVKWLVWGFEFLILKLILAFQLVL